MKTDDLIEALALEPAARAAPDRRVLAFALAGTAAAVAATLWLMGPRPGLAETTGLASFAGKAGYTVMLAAVGFWLLDRLGRPGAAVRAPALALALLALAAVAAAILELAPLPAEARMGTLMGSTASVCPWRIAGLGLLVLPPALLAARRFAPLSPALAGAAAGLFAGGLAATAYGLHCGEQAVSFLVVWYTAGVLLTALLGALAGARLLRW